jgi:hypothetical protein
MKLKGCAWLIIGVMIVGLAIPQMSSADYERRSDRREGWWERWRDVQNDRGDLAGTWYLNGDRDKPCEIFSTGRGLGARNERGNTTSLVYGRTLVEARDWRLRGEVRQDRIHWENGTTWTRYASRNGSYFPFRR